MYNIEHVVLINIFNVIHDTTNQMNTIKNKYNSRKKRVSSIQLNAAFSYGIRYE